MWRSRKVASRLRSKAEEDQESDQSISEEEEEGDWTECAISLGRAGDKGGMQVLSQLDLLRDSYQHRLTEEEPAPSQERKGGYDLADDDIENPLFFGGDGSNHSPKIPATILSHPNEQMVHLPTMSSVLHVDEEPISDDEETTSPVSRSARENAGSTWSAATREAEALICLNKNSSHLSHRISVKENKLHKGGSDRGKPKLKFMFRSHSHSRNIALVCNDGSGSTSSQNIPPDEIGAAVEDGVSKFFSKSELVTHQKELNRPKENVVVSELDAKHDFGNRSVAESLESITNNDLLPGSSKQGINIREQSVNLVSSRIESPLGHRNVEDDELPEALSSPFCSDDEEDPEILEPILPRRTMVDQFHDAFGMAFAIDNRPYSAFPQPSFNIGLYQRLQQVMQREKDRDMDYLKNISTETSSNDEQNSIDVKILSRSFEAKLIICSCASVQNGKVLAGQKSYYKNTSQDVEPASTVIFNPRVCSDVEVEVGGLIRIHPPWKEVEMKGKTKRILLCTYFSQLF